MNWTSRKPVTGKLPLESGNWQGNKTVETLTGFWDDQLSDIKDYLDNPTNWLGSDIDSKYLDYVGLGLCGFGAAWKSEYPDEVKRQLIRNHRTILLTRGSRESIERTISILVPGSNLIHFEVPRSDIALAGISQCSDYPQSRYMICLPTDTPRSSRVWGWMQDLITNFFPIGEVSLQYQVNLPNLTIAGDWAV